MEPRTISRQGWVRTPESRAPSMAYAEVRHQFVAGDVVEIDLPVRAGWVWADPRVDPVRGQVAVQRGPVVMCPESVDLAEDVNFAAVNTEAAPVERDGQVLVPITTARPAELPWPFPGERPAAGQTRDAGLVPLVPYHRWGNRGPATMRVWIPEA